MLNEKEITEIRTRRLNAWIDMLERSYQVDSDGLAALMGMTADEWEAECSKSWGESDAMFFVGLAKLVGNPMRFLFAEDVEEKENGKVFANPDEERERKQREQYNLMEYTINHGRDVMTLCSESLLDLAMKQAPGKPLEHRELSVLFGLHDVCELEAKNFDEVLETA